MSDDDATKLPLEAFVSGQLIPHGDDLAKIESTIEGLEQRRNELSSRMILTPWAKADLHEIGKQLGRLYPALEMAKDVVRSNPVSSEIYKKYKEYRAHRETDASELAGLRERRARDDKHAELTPEQKLERKQLEQALAAEKQVAENTSRATQSPAAQTKKATQLTPEQKLERAALAALEDKAKYSNGSPPAQRGLPEMAAKREDIERWLAPSPDDDFEGPSGR